MLEVQRSRIGRYEVLAELGRGAMGIVYRARDPQIDRVVAIKTLRPDLGLPGDAFAELRQRFYQEATAAGRLNHPNIVAIHDVLDVDGVPYIVMECLEGRTVADLLAAEGRLDVRRAVRLFAQVCEALDYAHARGVVHRDIKPSNIVVIDDDVAKVTDFGIARVTGSTVTQTGAVLGTPAYMSPEQLRGKVPDGRSDLFAVGVSLYEVLAGANPFHSEELAAVLYRVVHETPTPLRERNPGVSPVLQAAIERAVAKDPSERHPTARAFGEALARSVGPATAGQTTVILPEGARRRRRRRLAPALIGMVALLATGGGWGVWSAWSWLSAEPPDSASPPSTAAQPAARRTTPPGAIRISTNAAVDVLVDGEVRGRSNGPPLVIANVPAGDRVVTLRLGEREHSLSAFVPEGQTVALHYQFPPESAPSPSAEDVGRRTRETVDRLRGTVDKAQKEAVQTLRGVFDRAGSALDQAVGGGRRGSSKSEGR